MLLNKEEKQFFNNNNNNRSQPISPSAVRSYMLQCLQLWSLPNLLLLSKAGVLARTHRTQLGWQCRPDFSYFLHPLPVQGTLLFSLHSRCLFCFFFHITGSSSNFSCYRPKRQILIFSNMRYKEGEGISKVSVENSNVKPSSIHFPDKQRCTDLQACMCTHVCVHTHTPQQFHLQWWWGLEALKKCHFYTDSGIFV